MNRIIVRIIVVAAAALAIVTPTIAETGRAVYTAKAELHWMPAAIPQVSSATVDGDMAKGPCRFFLKYAAGFVTPLHHHSPDHFVTTISGNLVVSSGGREHRLPPGSFFTFTGKAAHSARCEGSEDCVMFVQALGAWDVVPEPATGAGK